MTDTLIGVSRRFVPAAVLADYQPRQDALAAGIVTVRQRPGTARQTASSS